ncbi:ABC transporter substrate-binding protein [Nodosilinea sp. LEGE 06152]|uniref:ABC transporter substrate-binding protein n=1 Tax=Nodosilinea sp. LEGE 06152 TaxID=2777966 RepID=UPI00187E69EF|nr:ABC transporter substrate-binding protein [Nodosilinea sp. LEGE 06152]MBE9160344.1 ABC transporter substrate-binding protein [Nodosilinea sp. LEGE 06152]
MRLPFFKIPNRLAIAFLAGLLLVQLLGLAVWWASWPPVVPTTLSFVVPSGEAATWEPLIANFREQNPDIRLELVQGDYDTDEAKAIYSADLRSRRPKFDLVYMDVVWLPWFASEGWLQDLSDLLSEEELAKFLPSELAAGRYQDTLYRLPFRADLGLLFYNQALMADLGVEPAQTFEALMAQSQRAQALGLVPWGYLWQGRSYEGLVVNFVEVLAGYGGFWIEPSTGAVGLDQAAAIAAANFLADTIRQGVSPQLVTSYGETETFSQFLAEQSLFVRNWPYFWKRANQNDSPLAGQVGLASVVAAAGRAPQGCRGGWGFGIAQNTAHPEAARRAIAFFTSAAAQQHFVLDSAYLPSRTDLYTDPKIVARYPFFPEVLEALENASVFRPSIPQYDKAAEILRNHLTEVLVGDITAEKAMRAAAAETRELLAAS